MKQSRNVGFSEETRQFLHGARCALALNCSYQTVLDYVSGKVKKQRFKRLQNKGGGKQWIKNANCCKS